MTKRKTQSRFKILIFILAGMLFCQAISIGILWHKNLNLRELIFKKAKAVSLPKKPHVPRQAILPVEIAGKAALVLDDWGYNTNNVDELFGLEQPLTISILPNLPFSNRIAKEARRNNIEVMLHLPLEAHDSQKRPEKETIYTYMSQKDALAKLEKALASVPYARGVSNHMGSKATEDKRLMKLLFVEFKKRRLYFLDSLVTNNSVCAEQAYDVGIKFAERTVFLDNENNLEYIKGQLRQLLEIAKQRKTAIGTGHDRPLTIKAIKEMLLEFQREGVKLVYVSEFVK